MDVDIASLQMDGWDWIHTTSEPSGEPSCADWELLSGSVNTVGKSLPPHNANNNTDWVTETRKAFLHLTNLVSKPRIAPNVLQIRGEPKVIDVPAMPAMRPMRGESCQTATLRQLEEGLACVVDTDETDVDGVQVVGIQSNDGPANKPHFTVCTEIADTLSSLWRANDLMQKVRRIPPAIVAANHYQLCNKTKVAMDSWGTDGAVRQASLFIDRHKTLQNNGKRLSVRIMYSIGSKSDPFSILSHDRQQYHSGTTNNDKNRNGACVGSTRTSDEFVLKDVPFFRRDHRIVSRYDHHDRDTNTATCCSCWMVAVLTGTTQHTLDQDGNEFVWQDNAVDTIIHLPSRDTRVRYKSQCLPLLCFPVLDNHADAGAVELVWHCHVRFQKLLENLFHRQATAATEFRSSERMQGWDEEEAAGWVGLSDHWG